LDKSFKIYDTIKYKDKYAFEGKIKVYKNGQVVVDKNNKIVLVGRNYIMQRLFNQAYAPANDKVEWIPRWFSIGSGGAAPDTPFQPIWPTDEDTELFNLIPFNDVGGPLYTLDKTKKLVDSLTYTAYLTAKFTMTVDYEDAVDSYINEVGLYASPSENQDETNFVMLSHATFPSIPKSSMDKISIEWFFVF